MIWISPRSVRSIQSLGFVSLEKRFGWAKSDRTFSLQGTSLPVLRYRSPSGSGMPPNAAVKTETMIACPFTVLQPFVRSRQVRIIHLHEYPGTACLYDTVILRCLGCYYLSTLIVTVYSTVLVDLPFAILRPPLATLGPPIRYLGPPSNQPQIPEPQPQTPQSQASPQSQTSPQSQAPDSPVTSLGFPDLPCQYIRYVVGGRYINQHAFLLYIGAPPSCVPRN